MTNLGNRIVFIGDSITEWGKHDDQEGIGTGYVRIIHDYLKVLHPEKDYEIFNKGIGGNRIIDLEERWQEDVINLKPDTVSISIGINDVWRQLDHPELEQVDEEKFEAIYRHLLKQVQEIGVSTIVFMEPTIIEEKVDSVGNQKLKAYAEIVRVLATEFEAVLVPTHQRFIQYLVQSSGYNVTVDGVHMNSAGNLLMAHEWLRAVKISE
ncbi:SGNH/GDSL hydrolase family protein [Gracilibacillus caseinilyticus]|uniref:SGNH/GDSL hydrolase family protein n=1 Tax=Gracilibacillus caseinilyticus TaxID=2932256 RepID=A0ABY4EX76_9BACI|nr:SGNH/GDSL hydrolase family protein [Gracilibacillus caseinilyticus]UOQ48447.1 SGNH/GDSL hydrolase family protein [Gracilibacillus caseinilyticus]